VPQCIEKSGGNVHTKTLPFRNLQTSAALAACAGTKLHVQNIGIELVKIEDNNENSKNKRLKTRIVDD